MSEKTILFVSITNSSFRQFLTFKEWELMVKNLKEYFEGKDETEVARGSAIFLNPPKH
jgi:hypothetical protein